MIAVVGLGNPEERYKGTRHNAGFEVIDKLAYDFQIGMSKRRFKAITGEGRMLGKPVILLKPQTYMNNSGETVAEVVNFFKLLPEELIVIYDDCNLDIGSVRVRTKGSAGGHNGIKSILWHLESEDFLRVRVGIGEKPKEFVLADYVLSRFHKSEFDGIVEGYTKASKAVELLVKGEVSGAMNTFNQKVNKVKDIEKKSEVENE